MHIRGGSKGESWPTELQTQIMSTSQTDKVRINPHTEGREGPLNYSNAPEEVLV